MAFVGRERELRALDQLYDSGCFQLPVIYGRRRVGKTSLINKFIEGKPAAVFTALESSAKENLVALSQAVAELSSDADLLGLDKPAPVFESFDAALERVFLVARSRRIVFVIDEFPYLAQSYRPLASLLQAKIDREKNGSKLLLILCGSSMSFMEHQVLGHQSPLYGRRTAQIKVEAFDVFDSAKLFQRLPAQDLVAWYGMVGGVPLYLEQYDPSARLEKNIAEKLLRTDSFLYGEPDSYLQQELRDPAMYKAIVRAIASGRGKPTEIADVAGIDSAGMISYLKSLIELGIVRKEQPVLDANRKKVRYRIADNLFRFWYRFIPQYATPLQVGRQTEIARLIVERHLSTFLGAAFEEVCSQWVLREMGTARVPLLLNIGRWWGSDPGRREQAEIDLVGICDEGGLLVAECKWREKLVGADVLDALEHRSQLLRADKRRLFVFARAGFTEACRARAEARGIELVSLDEMGL